MLPTVGAVALGTLRAGRLAKGETVLVTSGAGGIGHLAVQLARQQGAGTVIATAGSAAKLQFLAELGADVTIDHSQPDWADQVRAAVPDGIDVVLDAVGGAMLNASIGLLKPLGRVVVYGAASGDFANIPVRSLFGLKTVTGFGLLAWRQQPPSGPEPTSLSWPACSRRANSAPSPSRSRYPRSCRRTASWRAGRSRPPHPGPLAQPRRRGRGKTPGSAAWNAARAGLPACAGVVANERATVSRAPGNGRRVARQCPDCAQARPADRPRS